MKKVKFLRLFLFFGFFAAGSIMHSCEKEPEIQIKKEKINGYIQKGPFINGTQILMSELNDSFEKTGKIFSSQISNDRGAFEINNIELVSQYVDFSATGFYFNEITGEISPVSLTLFAISDISDISTVNVNVLTHLEKRRVEFLLNDDRSFSEAKKMAQAEVLALFGIHKDGMQDSENLDISINHDDNAILLAISLILQGERSVGELTELLASISTDIREDGVLNNENVFIDLRNSTKNLNPEIIRENLTDRYNALGITASIPEFETYIESFLVFSAQAPEAITSFITNLSTTSVTLVGNVNPNNSPTRVSFQYGKTEYEYTVDAENNPYFGNNFFQVSANVANLEPNTNYNFRVKAENAIGVSYGNSISFKTIGGPPIIMSQNLDIDLETAAAEIRAMVNPNHLITQVFFEWGLTSSFENSIEADPSIIEGNFGINVSAIIPDLQSNTNYYFRVKAVNSAGEGISDPMIFKTPFSIVYDIDGNIYPVVLIGNQQWMAKNLLTTRYSDNSPLISALEVGEWLNTNEGAFTVYPYEMVPGVNSEEQMIQAYGLLYNGYAVNDARGICPAGWRVPSNEDWLELVSFLDPNTEQIWSDELNILLWISHNASGFLRSKRTSPDPHPRWDSPNAGATNSTLFSALPGGVFYEENFQSLENTGSFWSSSSSSIIPGSLYPILIDSYNGGSVFISTYYYFNNGASIRCIKYQ